MIFRDIYFLQYNCQGLGLRPKLFRLAKRLSLPGFVRNQPQGLDLVVEGNAQQLFVFHALISRKLAKLSPNCQLKITRTKALGEKDFLIAPTLNTTVTLTTDPTCCYGKPGQSKVWTHLQPDQGICACCQKELFEPSNRRYFYPFISCAECGPRYSISTTAPFDRNHTSFKAFPPCAQCTAEYQNPVNKRFHAQTLSCPNCGPSFYLTNAVGEKISTADFKDQLALCQDALKQGQIIVAKTVHGFQLWANAQHTKAIQKLRRFKQRAQKPFAVMFANTAAIEQHCYLSSLEQAALSGAQRPIVLLKLKEKPQSFIQHLTPGLQQLGCMLPTSALHLLLLHQLDFPIIVTSGNCPKEPIYGNQVEALERLGSAFSLFWLHDLEVHQPIDDAVLQLCLNQTQLIRRSRGFVPSPIPMRFPKLNHHTVVALGAHEKVAFARLDNGYIFLSSPMDSLESPSALKRYQSLLLPTLKQPTGQAIQIICDLHPGYSTTELAKKLCAPSAHSQKNAVRAKVPATHNTLMTIQHHHSHFLSVLNEYADQIPLQKPTLGLIWDGNGLSPRGQAWGGEWLLFTGIHQPTQNSKRWPIKRIASFSAFELPGFEAAIKANWRTALSLLVHLQKTTPLPDDEFDRFCEPIVNQFSQAKTLLKLLQKEVAAGFSQSTTSVGRLFDALSSLLNLCHENTYQGEAALKLMAAAQRYQNKAGEKGYTFCFAPNHSLIEINWQPALKEILEALQAGVEVNQIAYKFHLGLAQLCAQLIAYFSKQYAFKNVLLSGGVWQNSCLVELTQQAIFEKSSLKHLQLNFACDPPANDAGLAVGQLIAGSITASAQCNTQEGHIQTHLFTQD